MVEEAVIVCDISGSMMECGKRFIMRTVLRTIDQYYQMLNPAAELKIMGLRSSLEKTEWSSGDALPDLLMDCSGQSSVAALIDEFGDYLDSPIIFLTDGYWDGEEEKFSSWIESVDEDCVRVILIGADANPKFKGPCVFNADDLLLALEDFGG